MNLNRVLLRAFALLCGAILCHAAVIAGTLDATSVTKVYAGCGRIKVVYKWASSVDGSSPEYTVSLFKPGTDPHKGYVLRTVCGDIDGCNFDDLARDLMFTVTALIGTPPGKYAMAMIFTDQTVIVSQKNVTINAPPALTVSIDFNGTFLHRCLNKFTAVVKNQCGVQYATDLNVIIERADRKISIQVAAGGGSSTSSEGATVFSVQFIPPSEAKLNVTYCLREVFSPQLLLLTEGDYVPGFNLSAKLKDIVVRSKNFTFEKNSAKAVFWPGPVLYAGQMAVVGTSATGWSSAYFGSSLKLLFSNGSVAAKSVTRQVQYSAYNDGGYFDGAFDYVTLTVPSALKAGTYTLQLRTSSEITPCAANLDGVQNVTVAIANFSVSASKTLLSISAKDKVKCNLKNRPADWPSDGWRIRVVFNSTVLYGEGPLGFEFGPFTKAGKYRCEAVLNGPWREKYEYEDPEGRFYSHVDPLQDLKLFKVAPYTVGA